MKPALLPASICPPQSLRPIIRKYPSSHIEITGSGIMYGISGISLNCYVVIHRAVRVQGTYPIRNGEAIPRGAYRNLAPGPWFNSCQVVPRTLILLLLL